MYSTKRCGAGIWKTSTLPLLFHGLCEKTKTDLAHCETVNAIEKKTRHIAVRLSDTQGGSPSLLSHDGEHSEFLVEKGKRQSMILKLSSYKLTESEEKA